MRNLVTVALLWLTAGSAPASGFAVIDGKLQDRANSVLVIMGFTQTPDVTTGSLSFSQESSGNPDFGWTSFGGGFTVSREVPLYLEGTAAFARYDPVFVASDGTQTRTIPAKWNSVSGTAGIGWDFRLSDQWVLRPIFNFSLGHVESDLSLAERWLEYKTGVDIEFLKDGHLNAYGLGGSLMLDYERYRPEGEIDVELRYTNISLQSFGSTSEAVEGSTSAQSAGLWSRYRAPTGVTVMDRPLRYVLEFAHTQYLGDLRGALGFDWLSSLGAGIEFDSSKYDIIVTRTRLLYRYQFGDNVQGWSLGVAVSF